MLYVCVRGVMDVVFYVCIVMRGAVGARVWESVKTCGDLRVSISREHCTQRLVIMLINSSTGKRLSSTRKGYKMQTINTCLPL